MWDVVSEPRGAEEGLPAIFFPPLSLPFASQLAQSKAHVRSHTAVISGSSLGNHLQKPSTFRISQSAPVTFSHTVRPGALVDSLCHLDPIGGGWWGGER